MNKLSHKQEELIMVLERGDAFTTSEISDELGVPKQAVRQLVSSIRKRFLDGQEDVTYIYTTPRGYSLDEKPEDVAYESKLRMQIGFGVLINGSFVFKRCKKIACSQFNALRLEFKPKMLTVKDIGE